MSEHMKLVTESSSPRDKNAEHIKETKYTTPDAIDLTLEKFSHLKWFIHSSETYSNKYKTTSKSIQIDLKNNILHKFRTNFSDEYCLIGRKTETGIELLSGWCVCSFQRCQHVLTDDIDMAAYRVLSIVKNAC